MSSTKSAPVLSALQKAKMANAHARTAWAEVDVTEIHREVADLLSNPQVKALLEDLAVLFGALQPGDPVREMLHGIVVAGLRIPQHVDEAEAAAKAAAA
jgi:hypothetical protein